MYNAPYQGVANELAKYGRYGDSMLVHMNPIEVQMLASLSPTGRLTTNPVTGQQEAFLPFLAPLLGSFLGNAALGSTLAGALGSKALGAAAAGALGSAAATTAVTGDLEQGIMAGITGFGVGSALGGLGELTKAGTAAAETAAQGATTFSPGAAAATMNPMAVDSALQSAIQSTPSSFAPGMAGAQMAAAPNFADVVASPAVTPPPAPTFSESLAQPFQQPGQFLSQLAQPGSFLPIYVGETGRMAREQELMGRGSMAEYEREQEKERQRVRDQMGGVFNAIRSAYPGVGYAQGGYIDRYYDGGSIEEQAQRAAERALFNAGIPEAKDVQLSLRGQYALTPPKASYSALDVGGEGYLPGVAPEFRYFTDVDPNAPPTKAGPPAGVAPGAGSPGTGGDVAGSSEFNLEDFLGNFGGYRRFFGNQGQTAPIETPETVTPPDEDMIAYPGGSKDFDYLGGRRGGDLEDFPTFTSPGDIGTPLSPGGGEMPGVPQVPGDIIERLAPERRPEVVPFPMPEMEQPPVSEQFAERPAPQISLEQFIRNAGGDLAAGLDRMPPPVMSGEPATMSRKVEPDISRMGIASLGATNPFTGMPDIQMPAPQMAAPQMPPAMEEPPQMAAPPQMAPPQMAAPEMAAPELSFPDLTEAELRQFRGRGIEELISAPAVEAYQAPTYELPVYSQPSVYDEYGLNEASLADMGLFAEGGMTEVDASSVDAGNQLVEMTVAAIRGEVENADQIINAFIQQYGPELFMDLRERVLQDIIPGAQTQGMIEGEGGGQDDLVEGMIGTQRPVAVSPGEYIIPADAVALAGGGYSGDGAKFFDGLVDDIRQKTMGTTQQVRPYRSA